MNLCIPQNVVLLNLFTETKTIRTYINKISQTEFLAMSSEWVQFPNPWFFLIRNISQHLLMLSNDMARNCTTLNQLEEFVLKCRRRNTLVTIWTLST